MTAALPREYSPPIEQRLGALLLAVVVLFSPSGILAHRDAYRAGLIATALPLPLLAAYVVTGSADPDIHPASPGFARTLISDETGVAHLPPRGIAVAVRPAQERNHSLLVRTAQSSALRNPVLTPGLTLSGSVWDPFTQRIFALGNLTVTTPSLTLNPGQSWAQPGSITLQGTTLTNHQGTLTVSDNLTVNGSVTNHWGVIQTGQHFTVNGDLTNLRSPASATYTQTAYDTVLGVDQNGSQVRCDVGSGGSGYCRWHEEFGGTEHGNIASGGDITVTGTLHNIASQVVAQGAITAGNLLNESQHLRIVWEEYRDHKSAADTLTPPLYLDPPFNTILNPAANTFFKTPLLGLIAANSITGGTFVNEGVIQGNTVTLGAGVNGLTNPAIATVIPQNTGNAGQGAASGAAGASQANGTPGGNTVTILGQTVHLAGATVTGTTGGGQGGQGAGPLTGSTTGHSTTVRDADTVAGVTTHNITVATQPTPPTVGVTGNTVISAPDITIGTQTLAGPAVNPTGAAGQTVVVSATLADATINIDPVAVATPAVTVTQGLVNGPTVTPTGAAGTHVTAHVNTSVIVDSPLTTSFTGPDVAVNNVNLLAPHANAPPASAVSGPAVAGQTVPLLPAAIPLSAVNVPPTGGGNNPDSDGILLPDSPPIITPADRPGTAATAGGSEPITNRTNLLDLSVPAGTIIAGTLNLTGDTRNTGFIYADTINIADTVGRLINERRLANPGQHQYELGNGDYVTERGDRLQPGGFISATNWNVNAQSILNLSGTFEVKGLTPEDTAALTAAFKDQLRQLYGANFTDQEVIEHLIRDVHTNKAPNQFRQILAIAIAIAITVMTSGADGGYALTTLLGNQSAIVAAVGGAGSAGAFALNAAFTALLTGASTQLITTGRIDGRALFQNIAIAAVTAGLTHGFTSEFGHVPVPGGEALTLGQRFTNYAISAGVNGLVQEVAGTGDFRNAFLNSFVGSLSADAANWIGDTFPRSNILDAAGNVVAQGNPVGNIVAHAVLGCAAAAATNGDCGSGALGGALGELVAPAISGLASGTLGLTNPNSAGYRATVQGLSTLAAGLVSSALGRDGGVAANAANNAVANNFLNHQDVQTLAQRIRACGSNQSCIDDARAWAVQQSHLNDLRLATCDARGDCDQIRQELLQGTRTINQLTASGQLVGEHSNFAYAMQNRANMLVGDERLRRAVGTAYTCRDANAECMQRAQFLMGVGRGLASLTVPGILADTGIGTYTLTRTIIENGLGDTVSAAIAGLSSIPSHIRDGLTSTDPAVRGEALIGALSLGRDVVGTATATMMARLPAAQAGAVMGRQIDATGAARFVQDGEQRVFMGVDMHTSLPPPAAGWDYFPNFVKGARTDLQAYAHINGFQSEVRLANEIAGSGQIVVRWGDSVGTHGNDVISINPNTGAVTLWDSKFRSGEVRIGESGTFAERGRREAAADQAIREIRAATNLSPQVQAQALANLNARNFTTNTVGSGNARNSVQVRYCSGNPC